MTNNTNNPDVPVLTEKQIARIESLVGNIATTRSNLLRGILDPKRDIDAECNYPSWANGFVSPEEYQRLYDRESIAARVVEVLPKETWQVQPTVYEVEDPDKTTTFEQRWRDLTRSLRGQSWFQDECGSPVWEYLLRADELSGVGQYGVILLGLDDTLDWSQPAVASPTRQLGFVRVFPESLAAIVQYEPDKSNHRFGQPVMYQMTFNDATTATGNPGSGLTTGTRNIHWTRCVHIADNLKTSSEVFGRPRMSTVLNRLLDLRKLYGGSAEMYWKGAFPGISVESNPMLGAEVDVDTESTRDQIENYYNGLQRYMALINMSAKSLAPQVVDPTPQINVQIEAICIKLGIPIRVFKGSERGELASSQDDASWNDRLRERQHNYVTPRIITPFVDRLIQLGVLPTPQGYSVYWPNLDSLGESDKATIAVQKTNAMYQYVNGGIEGLMSPVDFLVTIIGLSETQALSVVDAAQSRTRTLVGPGLNPASFANDARKNNNTIAADDGM